MKDNNEYKKNKECAAFDELMIYPFFSSYFSMISFINTKVVYVTYYGLIQMMDMVGDLLNEVLDILLDVISVNCLIIKIN